MTTPQEGDRGHGSSTVQWRRQLIVAVVVVLLALTLGGAAVTAQDPISGCTTIDESGSYELDGDIQTDETCIEITADDVHFDGNGYEIQGETEEDEDGIVVTGQNVTVRNVTVSEWMNGVYVDGGNDAVVEDVVGVGNHENGVKLRHTTRGTIASVEVNKGEESGSEIGDGVYLTGVTNSTVTGVTLSENDRGLALINSTENDIDNVTAIENEREGVELRPTAEFNSLAGITASDNENPGIRLSGASNNTLVDSKAVGNDGIAGVDFMASGGSRANNTFVENVTSTENSGAGFYLNRPENVTLENVTATENENGVYFFRAANNHVANSTVADNNEWDIHEDGFNFLTNTATTINFGDSLEPETTASFIAENVQARGINQTPPDNTEAESIGRYLEITEEGGGTSQFVDFELAYDDDDLGSVDEQNLTLWVEDGGWDFIEESTVETDRNVVTGDIDPPSFIDAPVGIFEFTDSYFSVAVEETNSPITAGQNLTVDAAVENVGNDGGTQPVELFVDTNENGTAETLVDSEELELGTDESEEVTLEWETNTDDFAEDVLIEVASENTTETDEVTIDKDANFDVAVVSNSEFVGGEIVSALESGLDDIGVLGQYELESVSPESVIGDNATDAADAYDVLVVNDFDDSEGPEYSPEESHFEDVGMLYDEVDNDTALVSLENFDGFDVSDAISTRADEDVRDDPDEVSEDDSGDSPVQMNITQDHPLFEEVGEEGDTVDVYASPMGLSPARAWFEGFDDGEVVGEIGASGDPADGPGAGVTDDENEVLLSLGNIGEFTDVENAERILANAVAFLEPPVEDPPFFDVTIDETNSPVPVGEDLNVTANVTNLGEVAGSQTVTLTDTDFDDDEQDTTDVSLDPGESNDSVDLVWNTDGVTPDEGSVTVASENDTDAQTVTVEDPFIIGECTTIDESGSYELDGDVESTGTCLVIASSDVHLDGNGYTVDGLNQTVDTAGVLVDGGETLSNVTVQNLTVTDWFDGVVYDDVDDGELRNVTAVEAGDSALRVENGSETDVENLDLGESTAANTTLSLVAVNSTLDSADAPPGPPEDVLEIGRYFEAQSTNGGELTTVELAYEEGDLGDVDEETLALWKHDGSEWTAVTNSSVDTDREVVTANVTEFSTFGALGQEPTAEIEIGEFEDQFPDGVAGDDYGTVEIPVEEIESVETENLEVTLAIDGDDEDEIFSETNDTETLEGEEKAFVFDVGEIEDADGYTATVTADADNAEETTENESFTVETPAEQELSGLDIADEGDDATITEGDGENVTVDVQNVGDQEGSFEVELEIDNGEIVVETETTDELDADETETITFENVTTDLNADDYTVTVTSDNEELTGDLTVEAPGDAELSDLEIAEQGEDATITEGDSENVTVEVENIGDQEESFEVELEIDNGQTVTRNETTDELGAGETETVAFENVTGDLDSDEFSVVVSSDGEVLTGDLTVEALAEPELSDLDIAEQGESATITDGDSENVTVDVQNIGDQEGTFEVELEIDNGGTVVETETTEELDTAETETIVFENVTTDLEADDYTVTVTSEDEKLTGDLTVEAPAEPDLSDLDIDEQGEEATITEGDRANISVDVQNVGDQEGSFSIELEIDNSETVVETETTDEIGAGETETVIFENVTAELDADDYTVTVSSEDEELTGDLSVETPAEAELSNLDIAEQGEHATITEGDGEDVSVEVQNVGDKEGIFEVELEIDNGETVVETETTDELDSGETKTVIFENVTADLDADDYTVTVTSEDEEVTGDLTVETPAEVDLSDLDIAGDGDDATITEGDTENVTLDVQNVGDQSGTFEVELEIENGQTVIETETTGELSAGETETVVFENVTAGLDADGYTVLATSEDEELTGDLTVKAPAEPDLSDLDIAEQGENATITEDDSEDVTVEVENVGDQEESFEIELEIDNGETVVETETTDELDAGETETVVFEDVTADLDADDYAVTISSEYEDLFGDLTVEAPAEVDLSDLDIAEQSEEATITEGDGENVSVDVQNVGDQEGSFEVELEIVNGQTVVETETTDELDADDTQTVVFENVTVDLEADDYTVTVSSDDEELTGDLTIEAPAEPDLSDIDIAEQGGDATITEGDGENVTVDVQNVGDQEGTFEIELEIDNGETVVETETTDELDPDETETVVFENLTADLEADEYTVTVTSEGEELTGDLTVEAQAEAELSNLDIAGEGEDATITENDGENVSVDVQNVGDQNGTFEIELEIDNGETVIETETTDELDAEETETVVFENVTTGLDADTYAVTVSSEDEELSGDLTVEAPGDADLFALDIAQQGTDATITEGDSENVTVEVENVGDQEESFEVELEIDNGQTVVETEITDELGAGETETVAFENVTADLEADDYTVTATSEDEELTGDLTVEAPAEPELSDLDIAQQGGDATIAEGDGENVSVAVQNIGDQEGSFEVELEIDNGETIVETETTAELDADETETITFENVTADLATDDYTVTVTSDNEELTGDLTVEAPAEAELSNLDIAEQGEDATITEGDGEDVSVDVQNVGDQEGTFEVELEIDNGETVIEIETTDELDAGETETVVIENVTADLGADEYTVTVSSEDEERTGDLSVEAPAEPDLSDLDIAEQSDDATITEGDSENVTVEVENVGDQEESFEVELEIANGETVVETESTDELDAGETEIVVFENVTAALDAGDYTVTVSSEGEELTGDLTVEAPAEAELSDLDIAEQGGDATITEGDGENISVYIQNIGDQEGTFEVELEIDNGETVVETETTDQLDGGETETVVFENVTGDLDADDYTVTVSSEDEELTGDLTVEAPAEAELSNLDIAGEGEDATITENDGENVSVDVQNVGDQNGTFEVELEIDNGQAVTRNQTTDELGSGETETVAFENVTADLDADEFSVVVSSDGEVLTGDLTIEAPAEPELSDLDIAEQGEDATITEGDGENISVTVQNVGDQNGTFEIHLEIDNGQPIIETETTGELSAGGTETVVFENVTAGLDADDYTVTISSESEDLLGDFTVEAPAEAELSNLDIAEQGGDATITEGDGENISVDIQNIGDQEGTFEVELEIDNGQTVVETETTDELDASEAETVVFENVTADLDADDYSVTISSEDEELTGDLAVEAPAEPELSNLDIAGEDEDATITEGDSENVSVDVQNVGDRNGTFEVELEIGNGQTVVETKTTDELDADETETVVFENVTADLDADEYAITVSSEGEELTGDLTVEAPAEAELTNLDIAEQGGDATITEGDSENVSVDVQNVGDQNGTFDVELEINNGETVIETETTDELDAEETETVTFENVTANLDADDYTVTVSSEDEELTGDLTVEAPAEAELSTLNIAEQGGDATITEGDSENITVDVQNVGDQSGTFEVELEIDNGQTVVETEITDELDAGETEAVAFENVTANLDADEYAVIVSSEDEGLTGDLTVEAPAEADLSDLDVAGEGEEATITEGDGENVTVEVQNVGDQSGTFEVELEIVNGQTVVETEITDELDADETETVVFVNVTADLGADDYTVTVSSEDEERTGDLAVEAPAEAELSNLDIAGDGEAATITEGDGENVSVDMQNVGDQSGTFEVELEIVNGQTVVETETTGELDAGETETILFENVTAGLEADEYAVTVSNGTETQSGELTVEEPPTPAFFDVTLDDVTDSVTAGETLTVAYTVENTGEESGTQDIVFEVNGTVQAVNTDVELGDNETHTDEFTYTAEDDDVPAVVAAVSSDNDTADVVIDVEHDEAVLAVNEFAGELPDEESGYDYGTIVVPVEEQAGVDTENLEVTLMIEHDEEVLVETNETQTLAGEEQRFPFTVGALEEPGVYTATVTADADNAEGVSRTVSFEITEETSGPAAALSGLDIAGEGEEGTVEEGESEAISVVVENTGEESGEFVFELRLENGETVTRQTAVTLNSGETRTVWFEDVTADLEPGEYTVSVTREGDITGVTGTLVVEAEPKPVLSALQIDGEQPPVTIDEGVDVSIAVDVENIGDSEDSFTIDLDVGDETDSQDVVVEANQTEHVEFVGVTESLESQDEPYTVTVQDSGGESDSQTGLLNVTAPEPSLSSLRIDGETPPTAIENGTDAPVTVDVENLGEIEETFVIELTLSDTSASQEQQVGPGETETVEFTGVTTQLDASETTYTASVQDSEGVSSTSGSLSVDESDEGALPPVGDDDTAPGDEPEPPGAPDDDGDDTEERADEPDDPGEGNLTDEPEEDTSFVSTMSESPMVPVAVGGGITAAIIGGLLATRAESVPAAVEVLRHVSPLAESASGSSDSTIDKPPDPESAVFMVAASEPAVDTNEAVAGMDTAIDVTVENIGDLNGIKEVTLRLDETVVDSTELEIDSRSTETTRLEYATPVDAAGETLSFAIDCEDDTTEFDIDVVKLGEGTEMDTGKPSVVDMTEEGGEGVSSAATETGWSWWTALDYLMGTLVILIGIYNIQITILGGALSILLGLLILPIVRAQLPTRVRVTVSRYAKLLALVLLLIGSGLLFDIGLPF